MAERSAHNRLVVGSNPAGPTIHYIKQNRTSNNIRQLDLGDCRADDSGF